MTQSKVKQFSLPLGLLNHLVVDFQKIYKALPASPMHSRGTKGIKLAQKMDLG